MTTKIVAFAASSSSTSINKRLVTYATQQLSNVEVEILDLNDFEMPLFSVDREKALGSPDAAQRFYKKIQLVPKHRDFARLKDSKVAQINYEEFSRNELYTVFN